MPISSSDCSHYRLEWRPHPAARWVGAALVLLAAGGLCRMPLPGIDLLSLMAGLSIAVRMLRRPSAAPWSMRVELPARRYVRRAADGRIDSGDVLSASATWPLFHLRLRADGSFGDGHVERYFPDTWQAPATRPWRLLVRAMRRPARPTVPESLG